MSNATLTAAAVRPQELLSMRQASALAGVEVQTLRLWDKAGKIECVRTEGNHRRVVRSSLLKALGIETETESRKVVAYCRVSTFNQSSDRKKSETTDGKSDLDRQKERAETFIQERFGETDYAILSDVGSGLSENRKNYLRLIEMVCRKEVSHIVVTSKDRLSRFGQESFTKLCEMNGCEIIIIDRENREMNHQEEMTADLLAIVHVYSSRYYGKRGSDRQRIELTSEAKERVVELRNAGTSYAEITATLKRERLFDANGKAYSESNIRKKLQRMKQKETQVARMNQEKQPLDLWLNERTANNGTLTATVDLYESYCEFCQRGGYAIPLDRNFAKELIGKGFRRGKKKLADGKRQRGFYLGLV